MNNIFTKIISIIVISFSFYANANNDVLPKILNADDFATFMANETNNIGSFHIFNEDNENLILDYKEIGSNDFTRIQVNKNEVDIISQYSGDEVRYSCFGVFRFEDNVKIKDGNFDFINKVNIRNTIKDEATRNYINQQCFDMLHVNFN